MTCVVQRVLKASVSCNGSVVSEIERGLLLLLGVLESDSEEDAKILAEKVSTLRIFDDSEGKLNLSVGDIGGEIMVVSNFTICGDIKKGRRPSFNLAARGEQAEKLYLLFAKHCKKAVPTKLGVFGGDMKIELVNDGPVTIVADSSDLKRGK